jgi:hypothetical protein
MILKTFEEFIAESLGSTLYNTPGMGNVVSSTQPKIIGANQSDSGDQDGMRKFHPDILEDHSENWMRPRGDYSNRSWILPNYAQYQRLHQSNTRFSIGDTVQCLNQDLPCYGTIGKIVAFEDNTIRFEVLGTETGIGQTAKQYRCHAGSLRKM